MEDFTEDQREGLDLFAQILEANARSSARASNDLTSFWAEDAKRMATMYIEFFQAVDKAAEVVTSRRLEKVLDYGATALHAAERIIEGADHLINLFDEANEEKD